MPKIEDHSISFIDFFNSRIDGMQLWVDVQGNREFNQKYHMDLPPSTWLVLSEELKHLLGPMDGQYGGSIDDHWYDHGHDGSSFTLEVKRGVWKQYGYKITDICAAYESVSGRQVKIKVL